MKVVQQKERAVWSLGDYGATNHHHHHRQCQQLSNLGMTNRVTDSRTFFQKLHPNFGRTNCVTNSRTIFHRLHTILGITNCVSISRTICQRPRAIFRMTLFVIWQIVSRTMTLFVKLDDIIVPKGQNRQIVTLILYVSSIFQIIAHNMV